jgi:DNA-binding IclR family transcriptional regulator
MVEANPGMRAGRVARDLELHRTAVMRALPAMEEEGLLLSEDDQGRLWSWRRRR